MNDGPTRLSPEELRAIDLARWADNDSEADFDLLADGLLPTALFFMLGSLVWFLLDCCAVLTASPLGLLRWIFGFFMLAVVGIARIRAREGRFDAAPFALALLAVMGLFGFFYAFGGGAFGEGYGGGNPVGLLLFLYGVIALIWFGAHYVVDRTAIDPNQVELQSTGLLSSEEWERHGERAAAVRQRPHPGRAVMILSVPAVAVFGIGHRLLAGQALQAHAFWCMVVFLGCGLAVLAMSALSGLQIYARARGARVPVGVMALWLVLAFPLAAVLLAVAEVAPRLEPAEGSLLPKRPAFLDALAGPGDDEGVNAPWGGDRAGPNGQGRDAKQGSGSDGRASGGVAGGGPGHQGRGPATAEGGPKAGGTREGQGAGKAADAKPADAKRDGQDAKGESKRGQGESKRGQSQPPQQSPQAAPPAEPPKANQPEPPKGNQPEPPQANQPERPEPAPAKAPAKAPEPPAAKSENEAKSGPEQPDQKRDQASEEPKEKQPESRDDRSAPRPPDTPTQSSQEDAFKAVLAALGLALLLGIAYLLYQAWRRRAPRAKAAAADEPVRTRDPFVDPFGPRSPFRGRPVSDIVIHIYRAFQAYAALIGQPRRPGVTAHDYLRHLPPSMETWRREIEQLTDLYAAVEYTPSQVDETCLDELRAIWARLMQAVGEVRQR